MAVNPYVSNFPAFPETSGRGDILSLNDGASGQHRQTRWRSARAHMSLIHFLKILRGVVGEGARQSLLFFLRQHRPV